MRTLYPVALAALVVSCHLDKLLNGGGGNGPPSEAAPARVAFSSSLGNARAGQPISPPVQVTVQDSAGRGAVRDTLGTRPPQSWTATCTGGLIGWTARRSEEHTYELQAHSDFV